MKDTRGTTDHLPGGHASSSIHGSAVSVEGGNLSKVGQAENNEGTKELLPDGNASSSNRTSSSSSGGHSLTSESLEGMSTHPQPPSPHMPALVSPSFCTPEDALCVLGAGHECDNWSSDLSLG